MLAERLAQVLLERYRGRQMMTEFTMENTEGMCDFCKYFYQEIPEEMNSDECSDKCLHEDGDNLFIAQIFGTNLPDYKCLAYSRGRPKGYPTQSKESFIGLEQFYREN